MPRRVSLTGNKQMRTLRVADLEAKPGEKVSGYVHVIGAEFGIPVTLICVSTVLPTPKSPTSVHTSPGFACCPSVTPSACVSSAEKLSITVIFPSLLILPAYTLIYLFYLLSYIYFVYLIFSLYFSSVLPASSFNGS